MKRLELVIVVALIPFVLLVAWRTFRISAAFGYVFPYCELTQILSVKVFEYVGGKGSLDDMVQHLIEMEHEDDYYEEIDHAAVRLFRRGKLESHAGELKLLVDGILSEKTIKYNRYRLIRVLDEIAGGTIACDRMLKEGMTDAERDLCTVRNTELWWKEWQRLHPEADTRLKRGD